MPDPSDSARALVHNVQSSCLAKGVYTKIVPSYSGIGLFLVMHGRLGILTLDVKPERSGVKVLVPGFMVGNQKVFDAHEVFLNDESLHDTSEWVRILTQVFFERYQRLAS